MNFEAVEVIRSRQNRSVVELCKLNDRHRREARRCFRFDGIKLYCEAVRSGLAIEEVFLRAGNAAELEARISGMLSAAAFADAGRVILLSDELFDKISEEKSPEGIICCAKYIDKSQKNVTIYNSTDFSDMCDESVVLLESVRDPSNIGAIIRSAAAMGVDRLIISADCADIYHPRAVRASMGALFHQRIDRVAELADAVKGLCESGRRVFAAALSPDSAALGSFALCRGDCVVIGNEGHGLSQNTVDACTGCVIIPMSGRTESFNAAVAASLLMWEFVARPQLKG